MKLKLYVEKVEIDERNITSKGKEYTFISQVIQKVETIDDKGKIKRMETDVQLSLRKNKDGSFYPEVLQPGIHLTDDGHYIDTYNTIKRSATPSFEKSQLTKAA